jgi:hypothetical protein
LNQSILSLRQMTLGDNPWRQRPCPQAIAARGVYTSRHLFGGEPLTRRIGNPSPSEVESGFAAITQALLDHNNFFQRHVTAANLKEIGETK